MVYRPDNSQFDPYAPPAQGSVDLQLRSGFDMEPHLPAPRGTRLGARIIDALIVMAIAFPIGFIGGLLRLGLGWTAMSGLAAFLPLAYQWYLTATTGQTIGKRMLGLKVVRTDGGEVGFVHGVVLREWITGAISVIPFIGGLVNLAGICLIFGDEQLCLHDRIAGTRVILVGATRSY
jgi:uncharacterized RDD family membrane protein YckC